MNKDFLSSVKNVFKKRPKGNLGIYLYGSKEYPKDLVCGNYLWTRMLFLEQDYYLSKVEDILLSDPNTVNSIFPKDVEISFIELGPGTETAQKTRKLFESLNIKEYIPVDYEKSYADFAADYIEKKFKDIFINPTYGNFYKKLKVKSQYTPFIFFPGSTIGNIAEGFDFIYPKNTIKALEIIKKNFASFKKSRMLVTADSNFFDLSLKKAYDTPTGKIFNLNIIHRINRDLGLSLNINDFDFKVEIKAINKNAKCVITQLFAKKDISFTLEGKSFFLKKEDPININLSYKYKKSFFKEVLAKSGWKVIKTFSGVNNATIYLVESN